MHRYGSLGNNSRYVENVESDVTIRELLELRKATSQDFSCHFLPSW